MPPKPDQLQHLLLLPLRPSSTTAAANDDDPPESFRLSQDAELDWLDRNAFLDRNHSTRATTTATNHHPVTTKLQLKKSSIIWLPKTTPRARHHHIHLNQTTPLVPKRILTEPTSPTVSCAGRVKPKKETRPRNENEPKPNRNTNKKKKVKKKKVERVRSGGGGGGGLWRRLREVFLAGRLKKGAVESGRRGWRRSRSVGGGQSSAMVEPVSEPVVVGLKRFSSGRKSEGWTGELGDVIGDDVDAVQKKLGGGLWRRRNLEGLELDEVGCARDWLVSGPASV